MIYRDGAKMSKSKGNVVAPDEHRRPLRRRHRSGSTCSSWARRPTTPSGATRGVEGQRRFLDRALAPGRRAGAPGPWSSGRRSTSCVDDPAALELVRKAEATIAKVTATSASASRSTPRSRRSRSWSTWPPRAWPRARSRTARPGGAALRGADGRVAAVPVRAPRRLGDVGGARRRPALGASRGRWPTRAFLERDTVTIVGAGQRQAARAAGGRRRARPTPSWSRRRAALPRVAAAVDGRTVVREIVVPDRLVNLVVRLTRRAAPARTFACRSRAPAGAPSPARARRRPSLGHGSAAALAAPLRLGLRPGRGRRWPLVAWRMGGGGSAGRHPAAGCGRRRRAPSRRGPPRAACWCTWRARCAGRASTGCRAPRAWIDGDPRAGGATRRRRSRGPQPGGAGCRTASRCSCRAGPRPAAPAAGRHGGPRRARVQPLQRDAPSSWTRSTASGPTLAARIVEWRRQHGGFASVDQLLDVPGIGEARLDALRAPSCPGGAASPPFAPSGVVGPVAGFGGEPLLTRRNVGPAAIGDGAHAQALRTEEG